MDGIRRGSLINLATRLLAVAFGLAITLYTARLGTAQQGSFALFTAVESTLLALVSGFGVLIARQVSQGGPTPGPLVGASVLACLGIGVVVAAALALVARLGGEPYRPLSLLAVAAPLMFVPGNLSGLWLGRARMLALARLSLAAPALTLTGLALAGLAGGAPALLVVLSSWVIARIVVALGALVAAWRGGWLARPDHTALSGQWHFVVLIGLTNLVGLLNYKIDIFLVERFLGLAPTGVYSIAVMVAELLWLVSSSVTTAAYARIGTPDAAAAVRVTLRAVHASVLLLLGLSPLLWLAAAELVPLLLGPAYADALPVMAVLLPGVALFGAASGLSAWFTNHAGRPAVPALLAGGSLLANVLVSVLLIPRLGMLGAALATTLSYTGAVLVGVVWFARASATPMAVLLRPDLGALARDLVRRRRRD